MIKGNEDDTHIKRININSLDSTVKNVEYQNCVFYGERNTPLAFDECVFTKCSFKEVNKTRLFFKDSSLYHTKMENCNDNDLSINNSTVYDVLFNSSSFKSIFIGRTAVDAVVMKEIKAHDISIYRGTTIELTMEDISTHKLTFDLQNAPVNNTVVNNLTLIPYKRREGIITISGGHLYNFKLKNVHSENNHDGMFLIEEGGEYDSTPAIFVNSSIDIFLSNLTIEQGILPFPPFCGNNVNNSNFQEIYWYRGTEAVKGNVHSLIVFLKTMQKELSKKTRDVMRSQ